MTATPHASARTAGAGVWRRRAEAVARGLPLHQLHPGALAEIRRAVAAGERVALACSGGADSVALVLTLWAHLPELRGRWLILHFDHRLRGAASTGDARFVAALARGLGESCVIGRWHRPASTRLPRATAADSGRERTETCSEAEARAARFAFMAEAMREAGARVLALGQHADDGVETMLMRLVRGSATGGLAAPRPVHRRADGTTRVRPLHGVAGAVLRDVLRAADTPWREDASNSTDTFLRNRLRLRVIPGLRAAAGRDVATGFLAARQALEDDDDALEQWLVDLAGDAAHRRWSALAGRPRAVARRAVYAWMLGQGLTDTLSRAASEALIDAVAAGRATRASAGVGRFVIFDGHRLVLEQATGELDASWDAVAVLPVGGEVCGPRGAMLRAEWVKLTPALYRALSAGWISPSSRVLLATDAKDFRVRGRLPGDRYRPLGAPGGKRVQDLLINRKIPRAARVALPVVCDAENRPIWIPGLPPAHEMAVHRGTKLVVQLTYTGPAAIVPSP